MPRWNSIRYQHPVRDLWSRRHEHRPPPTVDSRMMPRNTQDFTSRGRCPKPTVAKVRGFAGTEGDGGASIAPRVSQP